jgi:hypothetical protein
MSLDSLSMSKQQVLMNETANRFYVLLMESLTTVSADRSGSGGTTLERIPSPGCRWVKTGGSTALVFKGAGSLRGAWRRWQQSFARASGSMDGTASTTLIACEADAAVPGVLAGVTA